MEKRALTAMSGGVDSSVAALLLKQAGYDILGITLKLYTNEEIGVSREKTCCSLDDVNDARSVAAGLGIPFYVLNFSESFEENVIKRFVAAYERGETPNPCIDCNRYIKFEKLMKKGEELGYPLVATGHYARIEKDPSSRRFLLKKGADESKDQSYVLWSLTQEELSRLLLPLGGLTKEQVRKLAEENGFINAEKKDSQDICFVPDGDYAAFIERYTGKTFPEGNFIGTGGEIYGRHKGLIRYTVGQRKGLGLSFPQPMYVLSLDPEENSVTLGKGEELFSSRVYARDVNFIGVPSLPSPMRAHVKLRYRQKAQPARIFQVDENTVCAEFDSPQRAATPGQSLVAYDGDSVICGGKIFT